MSASSVIVGVDGSPESITALKWAAQFTPPEARLIAVRVWDYPVWSAFPSPLGGYPVPPTEEMESLATEQLATAVALIDREVGAEIIRGEPAAALVSRAGPDDMIVVGTRGYGAIRDWLMASVSCGCAANARCPVIVVPSGTDPEPPRRVTVGIDGSDNSHRAVRWALENIPAPTPIRVVTAWDTPVLYGYDPMVPDSAAYEEAAEKRLEAVCDAIAGSGLDCDRIEKVTVRGDARTVLSHESERADTLVVGSHGHGGILHLMLGSVASSLVHRPECPLVVVRADAEPPPSLD